MASDAESSKVDPQSAVEQLILASAPEKEPDLKRLWDLYAPQFSLVEDKPGFSLEAGPFGLVLFTNRTMLQIWLLGFAAWKAVYSYGGSLVLMDATRKEFDTEFLSSLPGQSEADEQFAALIAKVRELLRTDDIAGFEWPHDIPRPDSGKPADVEGSAVFDLLCLAAAYVFLHEVQHVIFRSDGTGPPDPVLEELECDRFARDLLLDSIQTYSAMSGFPADKVRSKRAIAIALGSFLLLVLTPAELWTGSRSHPPIAQRIEELTAHLHLAPNDSFWNYLSCLILSQLRVENRLPSKVQGANTKDLCLKLLALVGTA